MAIADTLPKILKAQRERYGDTKVAMRKKDLGIWKEYTWTEVFEKVRRISLGLVSIGFERGDSVAIIGDTDPQWYWVEYAAQAAGGAVTGIYGDARSTELLHLVANCGARFAFVKGQEQVDNISEIRDRIPGLKRIVFWIDIGLEDYNDPLLIGLDALEDLGRLLGEEHPRLFASNIERGNEEEAAAICYTRGAAGAHPRAIVLSHKYLVRNCDLFLQCDPWLDTGILVSHAPPISALDQIVGVAAVLSAAVEISFAEGRGTFDNDMREMGPHYLFCVASFWEDLISTIRAKMGRASYLQRALYKFSLRTAHQVTEFHFSGKTPPVGQRMIYDFANLLIFRPLRNNLGLSRVRSAIQGGAFLSAECLWYLHSIGIKLKQIYACAECGVLSMHREGDIRAMTVGPPMEKGTLSIGQDSEVLFERHGRPIGRYRNPPLRSGIGHDPGRLDTGDVGCFDADGHLVLVGRGDEVFTAKDGNLISLQSLEARLRFSPYIRHAMLIGGNNREFVSAIICISYENVGEWAKNHQITYTTFLDLSQKTQTYELVQQAIVRLNKDLPRDARIRKFVNLHKEFDADDGELTRNGSVIRSFVEKEYMDIIAAMYKGDEVYVAETGVKYRDGRTGKVRMGIQIRSLEEQGI